MLTSNQTNTTTAATTKRKDMVKKRPRNLPTDRWFGHSSIHKKKVLKIELKYVSHVFSHVN